MPFLFAIILSWLEPLRQYAVAQLAVWARWLVLSQQQELRVGYIEIEEPDGNVITRGTKPPPPPRHKRTNGEIAAATTTKTSSPKSLKRLEGKLKIHSNTAWLRLLLFGSLGLAEAYMAGEIDSPDLTAFLTIMLLAENRAATAWTKQTAYDAFFRWSVVAVGPALLLRKAHDVATARLNAVRHYSLSNAVFAAFLDETMTYSCPLWRDPAGGPSFAMTTEAEEGSLGKKTAIVNGSHYYTEEDEGDTLEEAQKRKLRFIVRAARIKPTDHVLEIGGGWGSFAILAARETGCRVTTITPSEEQASLIRERVAAAATTDSSLSPGQVQVLVCDYREVMPALSAATATTTSTAAGKTTTTTLTTTPTKKFDKIVSIEMLEHVGHECFETYFRCVDRYLTDAPGGIAIFQSITMSDAHYEAYLRGGDDFIRRHVFPGGELPSVAALVEGVRRGSRGRLVVEDVTSVGAHYARALRCWRRRFLGRFEGVIVPELQRRRSSGGKMGKGGGGMMSEAEIEVFRRKWVYYFASCEAAFRTKSIGDVVITVGRDGCVEFLEDSL